MNRVKFLALLATVALLALLPVALYAQETAPHRFYGTATLADGSVAPDGTIVVAMFGTEEAETYAVGTISFKAGYYQIDVPAPTGAVTAVTFTVGGEATGDSVTWVERGSQDLPLTGSAAVVVEPGLVIGLFGNNSSGQSGMATLTEIGDDLEVVLSLSSGALNTNLAHIHEGTCEAVGGISHDLAFFGDAGSGETTELIEGLTLAHVQDGAHYINLHWAENAAVSTACGNIPVAGETQPLPVKMQVEPPPPVDVEPPPPVDVEQLTKDVRSGLFLDAIFMALIRGVDGAEGADGAEGTKGDKGDPGTAGTAGSAGAAGDQGPAGSAGAKGIEGDDGSSVLGIIALILAIVALVGVGGAFIMGRRS